MTIGGSRPNNQYYLTTRYLMDNYRAELFANSTQTSWKSMLRAFRNLETFEVYGLPIGKLNRMLESMLDLRGLDSATLPPSVLWPLFLAWVGRAKHGATVEPNITYYILQNIQQLQDLVKR